MINATPEWNLPVLNFVYHLLKPWTDRFANARVNDKQPKYLFVYYYFAVHLLSDRKIFNYLNGRYIVSAHSFHFHCGFPKATKKEIRIFYLSGIVHIALSETEGQKGFNQYHLKMNYKHQVRIKDTSLLSQNKRERQIRLAKYNIAMRNNLFLWKLILTINAK